MKLKEVLRGMKVEFLPELFTPEAITVVKNLLSERNGKLYVRCQNGSTPEK